MFVRAACWSTSTRMNVTCLFEYVYGFYVYEYEYDFYVSV